MLKLAHFITKSEIGGAQTWVKDQISLLEYDFEHFLVTNKAGWLTDNVKVKESLFCNGIENHFSISTFIKVLLFVKKNKISVIVASSANAGIYARLIKIFHRCRVVYVSHGWSCIYNGGRYKSLFIIVERCLSYFTNYVLCVSKKDSYDAVSNIKINKKKIVNIRNCVFPRSYNNMYPSDVCFRILFLGRLSHPKRPDLLIEAVKNFPNVRLDIVGDGPLRGMYGEHNNVNFLGAIDNFDKFSDYDLFALISDSEGMPMSALEAASSGMPLLLSDVGGCSELVTDNGFLVKNSIDSIVIAIENILKNYTVIKHNALKCRADFDINKSYQKYKDLYSGVNVFNSDIKGNK